jgi:signal transduction histidine kinase
MSRTVVRRIETINDTSREIMSGDLSRRIPTRGSNDDFDQLAGNLNNMLERIEALMESVRQVSDNVAHDLKTPLSRLRNRLEEARTQAQEPAQHRATLDAAVADADQLLSTFNAVLRIARIEAKRETATFAAVDLQALVTDVAELYEPLAAGKDQRIVTSDGDPVVINGDRDLLFQALANLVDNAVKYTPARGTVQIRADFDRGAARLLVEDTGPGIPEAFRDRVFQRFFRIDPSRKTPGSGLGLSLVAAVAALHDLVVRLDDARPGLRVTLRFPDLAKPT